MDRGIRASLSPNEEGILYRVARTPSPRAAFRARDVEQLLKLLLVRDVDGRLELTAAGRERYRRISGAAPGSPPDGPDDAVVNS
jgi:hypothetical protein